MICNICLNESSEFDIHHVVWRSQGGNNCNENKIKICRTCHAILTNGCSDDRAPRDLACIGYSLAKYGIDFVMSQEPEYGMVLEIKKRIMEENININDSDKALKECGRILWSEMVAIILGLIPWDDRFEFCGFYPI